MREVRNPERGWPRGANVLMTADEVDPPAALHQVLGQRAAFGIYRQLWEHASALSCSSSKRGAYGLDVRERPRHQAGPVAVIRAASAVWSAPP